MAKSTCKSSSGSVVDVRKSVIVFALRFVTSPSIRGVNSLVGEIQEQWLNKDNFKLELGISK